MYLLDTNALSEPLKRRPSPAFVERLEGARGRRLFTTAICVMELRYGCARHAGGGPLWRRIEAEIIARVEILPIDRPIAERAGDLLAELRRAGRPPSTEDLLIAAASVVHGLVLVTHNVRDFRGMAGLRLEDWMDVP
jgi:predicted nucleic acid-binding protein